ncbi:MAG: hypothetical protein Q9220_003391 [cf. Caloplaca sp. 1 TL-2023]
MRVLRAPTRAISLHVTKLNHFQHARFATWRPITSIQGPTTETFQKDAFHPSLPVRLVNTSFRDIPASTRWFQEGGTSFDYSYLGQFSEHIVPLELTRASQAHGNGVDEVEFQRAEAPLDIFLQWADKYSSDTTQRLYVAQVSLSRLPKALQDDVPTPELVYKAGKGHIYDINLWLGVAPTYTPLHRDPNPNLYLQLAGHKIIRLLEPDKGQSVFAAAQAALGSGSSSKFRGDEMMKGRERAWLEAEVWNDERQEQESRFTGLEASLEAGESLFIPQGWWHSVKSVGKGCTGSVSLDCSHVSF